MELRRIFFVAFLLLISGSAVFAYQTTYSFNKPFAYQVWKTSDSTCTNIVSAISPVLSGNSGIGTTVTFTCSPPPNYGAVFVYPTNTEDYPLEEGNFDFSSGGTYTGLTFKKYRRSGWYSSYGGITYKYYELPAGLISTCHATYVSEHFNSAIKKLTVTVDNDLTPLQTVSGTPIKYNNVELHEAASLPPALKQILRKNYYTKYFVYLKLSTNSSTSYKDLYVLPQQLEKDSDGKIKIYGYPSLFPSIPISLDSFESEIKVTGYRRNRIFVFEEYLTLFEDRL